jgi:preprotein translocase subunit Sec61beta
MLGRRPRREATRWEEDNRVVLNPAAFVAVALLAGALVGLALLLWLL